jgi:hypothetical protein
MSEFDELDRLRDADPVKAAAIPSSEDPGPRALRERIMMSDPGTQRSRSRRTQALVSAAAAVALIASVGIVLATRGSDKPSTGGEPITPPGQAMCVENYDLSTLKNRDVAFDGKVVRVSGDEVTFEVSEWFKGGSADEITLNGASTLGGITSAGDPVPMDPGSRLLVAGDGGFAWSCGFTQSYSGSVANDWREALS